MSFRTIKILLLIAAGAIAWQAANAFPGGSKYAGGGAAPACSNSLDFSAACNSQYLGVIL